MYSNDDSNLITLNDEQLKHLQAQTRAQGRCGSLQTQNGMPCRRHPKAGYTVCLRHGARAPQTIAKAERLLAVARMPAIGAVLDIIEQWSEDTCKECGYPKQGDSLQQRTIIAAAKTVLDRAGLGPRATLNITNKPDPGVDISRLSDDEAKELEGLLDAIEQFKSRVKVRLSLPAIEGTVVE